MKKVLTLLVLASLLGGLDLSAQETETYDFSGFNTSHYWENNKPSFKWDGNYITGIQQDGKSVDFVNPHRISVTNGDDAWQIGHDRNHSQVSYLQRKENVGNQSIFINDLEPGDVVQVWVSTNNDNECINVSKILDSGYNSSIKNNESNDGQTLPRVTVPGSIEISVRANYQGIDKIVIIKADQSQQENTAEYSYDPSIESYDFYWIAKNVQYNKVDAGFQLNNTNAFIMRTTSGTPLNDRFAFSDENNAWTFNHASWSRYESTGLKCQNGWHNFSVCNLKAGDRVRITYQHRNVNTGNVKFGSVGTSTYNGCAAFQDTNNNGVQDEGEESVVAGMNLVGSETQYRDMVTYFYTVTEDGHLDIALAENVLLKKVELYCDHRASMKDRYNGSLEAGYTAYFDITGQLETKQHIMPNGLKVQIGNENEDQHALVVANVNSPVGYAVDERHRKFAMNSDNDFNSDLTTNLPTEGTYYKFTPEVSGTMSVRFYTSSINYLWPHLDGNYLDLSNTSNEYIVDSSCPYYLIDVDQNGNKTTIKNVTSAGNTKVSWENISVEAGHTYYLFGAWESDATAENYADWEEQKKCKYGCGIAKLYEVTFAAEKIVYPLAKWIENASTYDDDLAYVKGYKYVKVKKMSGGITSCEPYLDGTTLKIRNIQYATGDVDKAGVVLIEITDDTESYDRNDPVFALTVAYDASYHSTSNVAEEQRGHTWDFSSNPLNGLQWNDTYSTYAVVTPFGTSKEENSLLNQEMNWTDVHGTQHSDWTSGYRLKAQGINYDLQFLNNYDMVGDNADMMWDTEGMVILAEPNLSSINNEFGSGNIHESSTDPDRYVGILSGGEFLIPWLDKDDRVIIWMGSGTGPESETTEMVFNITNARDAEYKEISATDDYVAGGSHWDGATGDSYYRGCYHFFAKEHGDMRFKLVGGTMCKIYKIQIYHGDRINTNEIKGATENDKFLLWSTDDDPNEEGTSTDISGTYNWTLKYFNKDQKLADGTNSVNNDIISKTGIITASSISTNTDNNTFTYEHALGEIGTFRMRGKDMEKNMKYVADYAEHNVTVAYQETQPYPYTWDFKDMIGFSGDDIQDEDALEAKKPTGFTDDYWNSIKKTYYEITSNDLSLWETYTETGGYYLRLNSQANQSLDDPMEKDNIFETAQAIGGNQVWANGKVVPETQGLWFYTDDNFNHSDWYISNAGMEFRTKAHKLVVPNVPAGAAVYLRVNKTQTSHEFTWQWTSDCEVYGGEPQQVGSTNDYIFAIKNNGAKRNLVLSLKGYRLLKLGVSKDKKKLGKYGWATESRERIIDPSLTAYLSGKDIETIIATATDYASRTVTLERMNLNDGGDLMQATNADGTKYACILHNVTADEPVTVLDGGFHLFVPDMHDYDVKTPANSQKKFTLADKSIMKAQLTASQVKWSDNNGDTKNFVLTNTYLKVDKDDKLKDGATNEATGEGFYRVGKNSPITSSGNQGYLPVSTDIAEGHAKFSIVFVDFEDNFQGIATGITEAAPANEGGLNIDDDAEWFNLNGQKLNSKPSERGIYIMNGKKVMVK